MANFLVKGDLGFIGSHLTEELYNASNDVKVLDHLSNGHQNNLSHLKKKIPLYKYNLEQIKSTIFSKKFDGIFPLATAPRSSSLIDPFQDIETNCKGMISVLAINNPTTPRDANKLVSEFYCKICKE